MMLCPCGSENDYAGCCEPYVTGRMPAPTPEALMRSRYSAYVKVAPSYLRETLAPESRGDYSEKDVLEWARTSKWLGLRILKAEGNQVEFMAKYQTRGKVLEHHEVSTFRREGDRWYFVDGESHVHEEGKGHESPPQKPMVREAPKVGRNDPCACGSGKKFKKCCGN
ncbi:MAG: YchJ family protein [Bdellovibrionales bacterium]|nr:YchJ family protein [Bdellovibrionales bacterium]